MNPSGLVDAVLRDIWKQNEIDRYCPGAILNPGSNPWVFHASREDHFIHYVSVQIVIPETITNEFVLRLDRQIIDALLELNDLLTIPDSHYANTE